MKTTQFSVLSSQFSILKNFHLKNLLLLLLLPFLLGGCRYEEPVLNLQSAENRLIAELWRVHTVLKNGTETTEYPHDAFKKNNYYTFFYGGPMSVSTFMETGTMIESTRGEWEFQDNNKKLYMFFTLRNRDYNFTARIVKLSGKELKFRYTDDDGVEWTLEFYKN